MPPTISVLEIERRWFDISEADDSEGNRCDQNSRKEVRKELNWKVKDPKLGGRLMNIIGTDTVVNSNPRKLGDINKLTLKFIQKSKTPRIGI